MAVPVVTTSSSRSDTLPSFTGHPQHWPAQPMMLSSRTVQSPRRSRQPTGHVQVAVHLQRLPSARCLRAASTNSTALSQASSARETFVGEVDMAPCRSAQHVDPPAAYALMVMLRSPDVHPMGPAAFVDHAGELQHPVKRRKRTKTRCA